MTLFDGLLKGSSNEGEVIIHSIHYHNAKAQAFNSTTGASQNGRVFRRVLDLRRKQSNVHQATSIATPTLYSTHSASSIQHAIMRFSIAYFSQLPFKKCGTVFNVQEWGGTVPTSSTFISTYKKSSFEMRLAEGGLAVCSGGRRVPNFLPFLS